jgi:hypothetical protein
MSHRPNSLVLKHPGSGLGTVRLRGLDWARSPAVTLRLIRPPGRELSGSLSARLVLTRRHNRPAKRNCKTIWRLRPNRTSAKNWSPRGQPSSTRMASGWVYWIEFLDRDTAFDRVPGKSVEVGSHDQAPTHSIESV